MPTFLAKNGKVVKKNNAFVSYEPGKYECCCTTTTTTTTTTSTTPPPTTSTTTTTTTTPGPNVWYCVDCA